MRPPSRHSAGTVMMEMILVLPFLVFVLLLIFYFGRGVVYVQQVQVADRFSAWTQAQGAPRPGGNTLDEGYVLSQLFLNRPQQQVSVDHSSDFPTDASDALTQSGQNASADTGNLITKAISEFPKGSTATVTATIPSEIKFWQLLDQPIKHQHVRLGNDWKFANGWTQSKGTWVQSGSGPWMLYPARDTFFSDFENEMTPLDNEGNLLAHLIRGIYVLKPGYAGPTITVP